MCIKVKEAVNIFFNPEILLLLQGDHWTKVNKDVNARLLIILSLKVTKYLETI